MDNNKILIQIIILVLFIIAVYFLFKYIKKDVGYVKSDLNGKEYLVVNREDKNEAAYMLSVIESRILLLKDYLVANIDKYPEFRPYIEQLASRIDKHLVLQENSPNGKYTSYTVNKGEEISLCLRSKNTQNLHDINIIMYVVLHELAHVACPEIDHTELFKRIFIFFIKIATEIKIYKPASYDIYPEEYCGLTITENLLR